MSDTPATPDKSTTAQPGPIEHLAGVGKKAKAVAKKAVEAPADKKRNVRKIAGVGAAIGIGSAAIVAALLYANRSGGKK